MIKKDKDGKGLHLAEILQYNILAGNLKPGSKVELSFLAKSLGVGGLAIKEAADTVLEIGLLEVDGRGQLRVVDINLEMINQTFHYIKEAVKMALTFAVRESRADLVDLVKQNLNTDDYKLLVAGVSLCPNVYVRQHSLRLLDTFVFFTLKELAQDMKYGFIVILQFILSNDFDYVDIYFKQLARIYKDYFLHRS